MNDSTICEKCVKRRINGAFRGPKTWKNKVNRRKSLKFWNENLLRCPNKILKRFKTKLNKIHIMSFETYMTDCDIPLVAFHELGICKKFIQKASGHDFTGETFTNESKCDNNKEVWKIIKILSEELANERP